MIDVIGRLTVGAKVDTTQWDAAACIVLNAHR